MWKRTKEKPNIICAPTGTEPGTPFWWYNLLFTWIFGPTMLIGMVFLLVFRSREALLLVGIDMILAVLVAVSLLWWESKLKSKRKTTEDLIFGVDLWAATDKSLERMSKSGSE